MGARRRGGSRTGTLFVLFGILGVLTGTFVAGFWTGHNWPVLWGRGGKPPATETAAGKRGLGERPKPAEALPALTFYDELKAPLTAPPPPPRPAKGKPPALSTEAAARAEVAALGSDTLSPARHETAAAEASRFTVQVAAYNQRPPAETLRAMLASAGHDARVVEAATSSGVRYRVQVGAFPTRQAAQDAAARLTAERSLATFVTTR